MMLTNMRGGGMQVYPCRGRSDLQETPAVLLPEIAVKRTTYPKTTGNFKKQNFDGLLANLSSRMTKSAHCLRYMECHIPPTSKTAKPFLELRCILCRLSLRRTPNPIPCCHPEQVRNVVVMATMETFFRTRRSFAEKARCIQRHKSSLLFDLHRPRCTVRSKTAAGGIS